MAHSLSRFPAVSLAPPQAQLGVSASLAKAGGRKATQSSVHALHCVGEQLKQLAAPADDDPPSVAVQAALAAVKTQATRLILPGVKQAAVGCGGFAASGGGTVELKKIYSALLREQPPELPVGAAQFAAHRDRVASLLIQL